MSLNPDENTSINKSNDYNPVVTVSAYNMPTNNKLSNLNYQFLNAIIQMSIKIDNPQWIETKKEKTEETKVEDISLKEIWVKLEILKKKLRSNNVSDRKSACFWCL